MDGIAAEPHEDRFRVEIHRRLGPDPGAWPGSRLARAASGPRLSSGTGHCGAGDEPRRAETSGLEPPGAGTAPFVRAQLRAFAAAFASRSAVCPLPERPAGRGAARSRRRYRRPGIVSGPGQISCCSTGPAVCAGTDAAGHPGEVPHSIRWSVSICRPPTGPSDVAASHPAHTRPPTAGASTQAAIARTPPAADLGADPRQNTSQTAPCSADLRPPPAKNQSLAIDLALSCGMRMLPRLGAERMVASSWGRSVGSRARP